MERTCIVTRQVQPSESMIRFVLDPGARVVPDLKENLPGRGVWVGTNSQRVAKAIEKGLFSKAFRAAASADTDLVTMIGDLLSRRALDYLGFANRAGLVITGFAKVSAVLQKGKASVLIEAGDASEDGRKKLRAKFLKQTPTPDASAETGPRIVSSFKSEQLSLALGRTNVVHAALTTGRLAEEYLLASRRYEAYWDQQD